MSEHGKSQERVGRPRSEESTEAIINATIEILEEKGYQCLTIEAIASRAGVGKSTIYRWWANKELLILDVFLRVTNIELKFYESTSIEDTFTQLLISLTKVFSSTLGNTALSIVAQSGAESEIAVTFYNSYLKFNRDVCKKMLKLQMIKGEISGDVPLDLILDMLFGPLYFRVLIYKNVPTRTYIENLVNHVFKLLRLV